MKKLPIVIFMLLLLPLPLRAAEVLKSDRLIAGAEEFDTKTVLFEGEIIGDIMVRGKHAWLNVNDGKNAIGVWVETDLLKDVRYAGAYKTKGDWVEVSGVFHRACREHAGDLDIHALTFARLSHGLVMKEVIPQSKKQLIMILSVVFLAVLLLWFLKK